jgi:glycosyltransferase involved in cell wall biosynthesis
MRVLFLAPLWFPVSPDSSGGIETILPGIIAGLVKRGCRITLLASGDSRTEAELVSVIPRNLYALMQEGEAGEECYYEQHQLMLALKCGADFDVVHSHLGWAAYSFSQVTAFRGRLLHTHHNPIYRDLEWFIRQHPDLWFSTVSEFQAAKFRRQGATRCRVVPNGIDVAAFTFRPEPDNELLFLGRMEEEKGPDLAIRVARELGRPLTLAGPAVDSDYFARHIEPCLGDRVRYVGVVNHRQKNELLGRAACVLMVSRVEEGFGMVSIEAMACGTPVVGLARGALLEIIEAGLTGYLTEDEHTLPALVQKAIQLDRAAIRGRVAARFDIAVVAEMYHQLYTEIAATPR